MIRDIWTPSMGPDSKQPNAQEQVLNLLRDQIWPSKITVYDANSAKNRDT